LSGDDSEECIITMPPLTLAIIDHKSDFTCSWEVWRRETNTKGKSYRYRKSSHYSTQCTVI